MVGLGSDGGSQTLTRRSSELCRQGDKPDLPLSKFFESNTATQWLSLHSTTYQTQKELRDRALIQDFWMSDRTLPSSQNPFLVENFAEGFEVHVTSTSECTLRSERYLTTSRPTEDKRRNQKRGNHARGELSDQV